MCGHKSGHSETTCENTSVTYVFTFTNFYGAAKRIRTPDPRITNALLYQLSYCGMRSKRASILTRGAVRRKAADAFRHFAKRLWQRKYDVLFPPLELLGHLAAPLAKLRNDALNENLGR
jgi:hypothetical protein